MVTFIDEHREQCGVEPICGVLPIAPSWYYEHKRRQHDRERRPARAQRDEGLCEHIGRVWGENKEVYGPRKVWKQLRREAHAVARCTVTRLVRRLGLQGVVRGLRFKVTTLPDAAALRPAELVTRQFTATRPNQLWLADLTAVALALNTRPRKTLGWRTPAEALEQFLKSVQASSVATTN